MNSRQTFKKEERVFLQKEIDLLFREGVSFISYPLRVIYIEKKAPSEADASILISVSKRKFKQAVKRNRLKRLIRESYRLNKKPLCEFLEEKETGLLIAFLFVGKELNQYKAIETAVVKAINTLRERLQ